MGQSRTGASALSKGEDSTHGEHSKHKYTFFNKWAFCDFDLL